ncbi:uncharacterized protein LOC141823613 [Curcuma longa]|uniref:uncharacterized protein LOC141823613 n=1 Tax=Curcuma longa TaxID=136217 RepID=UPI003D9EA835
MNSMDGGRISLWSFDEPTIEDLNEKLMHAYSQLEEIQVNAGEELRKSNQQVNRLLQRLHRTTIERDEARTQLRFLLHQIHRTRAASPLSTSSAGSPAPERSNTVNADDVVDGLARWKAAGLPERGRLVEAVAAAKPLLRDLMVAGPPLPRWRNPPPMPAEM